MNYIIVILKLAEYLILHFCAGCDGPTCLMSATVCGIKEPSKYSAIYLTISRFEWYVVCDN